MLGVRMAKRQSYSMRVSGPSQRPRNENCLPSASGTEGGPYPQCAYMYGGLGEMRREPYALKSPLKMTAKRESAHKRRRSTPYDSPADRPSPAKTALKRIEKNSARTAPSRKIDIPMIAGAAVKTNPLLMQLQSGSGGEWGEGEVVERSAFYGQRRNIRKTKEQEMISAIMELARHGDRNCGDKRKHSLLDKVKSIGTGSAGKASAGRAALKRGGGPFILRPRPPLKNCNTMS